MKGYEVRFVIPTDWLGVVWSEERNFRFEEDTPEEEIKEEILLELRYWVDEILSGLRANAEYEVVAKRRV